MYECKILYLYIREQSESILVWGKEGGNALCAVDLLLGRFLGLGVF